MKIVSEQLQNAIDSMLVMKTLQGEKWKTEFDKFHDNYYLFKFVHNMDGKDLYCIKIIKSHNFDLYACELELYELEIEFFDLKNRMYIWVKKNMQFKRHSIGFYYVDNLKEEELIALLNQIGSI